MSIFTKLWKKIDEYFSKDESREIERLKQIINSMDSQITELNGKVSKLVSENKELKERLSFISKPIETPKIISQITYNECWNLLRQITSAVYISDNQFKLTSLEEAKKYTFASRIWDKTWKLDDHDCDNFSFALTGYWSEGLVSFAFGLAWSDKHAFNIFIDDKKQLWIVEPQTNEYMTIEESKKRTTENISYDPIRVIML